MDTNRRELLLRDPSLPHAALVYSSFGSAFEVLRGLGHGLHEKPCENALVVEFGLRNLALEQQKAFGVCYKGTLASQFMPDLIVGNAVVVDTNAIDRITKLQAGVILNFHRPKLGWERIVS